MWGRLLRNTALVLLGTGCASAPSAGRRDAVETAARQDVVSRADMLRVDATNALQAVMRLRPQFLRRAATSSIATSQQAELSVYMDSIRLGGVETLRDIPVEVVRSIQYLSASEAAYPWGLNHLGGVIFVRTLPQ